MNFVRKQLEGWNTHSIISRDNMFFPVSRRSACFQFVEILLKVERPQRTLVYKCTSMWA